MRSRHRFALATAFVALAAVASLLAEPSLPDQVVTHWDASGTPDGTMPKAAALALIPALAAGLVGLFAAIPRVDPLRENIAAFRPYYDWFVVLFTGFLTVLHVGVLAFNIGYEFDFLSLVLVGVAALFYYVGVLLSVADRNWFVGIRTPWTLSSDVVWERTHALGSRLFKLAAVLALLGLAAGEYAVYFVVGPALATAAVTVAYSFYLYEQLERDGDPDPGS